MKAAAQAGFGAVAAAVGNGMASMMKTVLSFWTKVPSPDLESGGVVAKLASYTYWVQGFVLVLSILIVAGKLCVTQSPKAAGEAARGLVVLVLVNGAAVAGIDVLTQATDAWAKWILEQPSGGFAGGLGNVNGVPALTGGDAVLGPIGPGIEFIVAIVGIFAALIQILLLIARIGVLTVLAGVLPLSASAIGTETGKQWFQKLVSWIVAFILYKPVAALIYAAAFTLVGQGKDILSVIAGLMLVILSVLALPAIMRLVVPMVGAATTGGGGALTGAVAGAALATGAKRVTDSRSGKTPPPATTQAGLVNHGRSDGHAAGAAAPTGAKAAGGAAKAAGAAGPVGAAAGAAMQATQKVKGAAEGAVGAT